MKLNKSKIIAYLKSNSERFERGLETDECIFCPFSKHNILVLDTELGKNSCSGRFYVLAKFLGIDIVVVDGYEPSCLARKKILLKSMKKCCLEFLDNE